jgi:hypothetical protein
VNTLQQQQQTFSNDARTKPDFHVPRLDGNEQRPSDAGDARKAPHDVAQLLIRTQLVERLSPTIDSSFIERVKKKQKKKKNRARATNETSFFEQEREKMLRYLLGDDRFDHRQQGALTHRQLVKRIINISTMSQIGGYFAQLQYNVDGAIRLA